jgi:hypothetical protein
MSVNDPDQGVSVISRVSMIVKTSTQEKGAKPFAIMPRGADVGAGARPDCGTDVDESWQTTQTATIAFADGDTLQTQSILARLRGPAVPSQQPAI